MADGKAALQIARGLGAAAEGVTHQTHMALGDELAFVIGDNACRFLAAMLQGMQAQHRQGAGIGMVENAEHAALFMQRVLVPDVIGRRLGAGHHLPFPPDSTSLSSACRSLAP